MINLTHEQAEKLFLLADLEVKAEIVEQDISRALVEIEKKLLTCSTSKSQLGSSDFSILIVDDLELSIHQLSVLLTKCGYNVDIARTVSEAEDQFKKHNYKFILLDLFMPEPEDGFGLLEKFFNDEKSSQNNTKILVVSGTNNTELINKCYHKGASEFIEKSPEWHKNIIRHLRKFESSEESYPDLFTTVEDIDRKIVSIKINNLIKDSVLEELEKEISMLVTSGYANIILDMENIYEINSKSVGTLVFGFKTTSKDGGFFKLCNVKSSVKETLSYFFLNNILQIYKDKKSIMEEDEMKEKK